MPHLPDSSPVVPRLAVVIGLCSHGLAVARALAAGGVHVVAVEKDPALPGVASRRVDRVWLVASFRPQVLVEGLLALRRELPAGARPVLFAMSDDHVRTIAENLPRLAGAYSVVWAASAATVLRLQGKDSLESHSRERGLNYPASAVLTGAEPSDADLAGLHFPVILKPVRPQSSFKTLLAADALSLRRLVGQHAGDLPILAQDFIAGGDEALYFAALLLVDGRVLHAAAGRKMASHPPAMGQTTAAATISGAEADDVIALATRFFVDSGLTGPASLEVKHGADGRWWVIEPTVGRTDFWIAMFIASGFNLPLLEHDLATGAPLSPQPAVRLRCIWFDTERSPMAWLKALARQPRLLGVRRAAFSYLALGDPKPFLRACQALLRRLVL